MVIDIEINDKKILFQDIITKYRYHLKATHMLFWG